MHAQLFSHVPFFATPWALLSQAPLFMGFPRQEYWSKLPFLPPGGLPNPETELGSPEVPELAGGFFRTELSGKPCMNGEMQIWIL